MSPSEPELLLPVPRRVEHLGGAGPTSGPPSQVEHDASLPAEGYVLLLDSGGIRLRHADENGRRYALSTLAQLTAQHPGQLPALRIEDHPDFPVRGYMLDISRDRVPTRATLARIVELMALFRLNHLQLYIEHTFAYRDHEVVWRDASPLTPEDVRWLDSLCQAHGIELCANQNSFGHMARWLGHEAYRDRAETPDGFTTSFGVKLPASVLAPTPANARFALGLCRELLSCHTSRRIHIGCDETFELGKGASAAAVAAQGRGRVYQQHLLRLLRGLHEDGHEVLFWGDMLCSHPELVAELPREDTVALAWHYEAPARESPFPPAMQKVAAEFGFTTEALRGFSGHVGAFVQAGLPFWVCPGTSTWNALLGRLSNARANLLDAAEVGRAHGAEGFLITDWGDNGHLQPPSASWPPLAYGAALAWCQDCNRDLPLARVLDAYVFEDGAKELGAALEIAAETHTGTGKRAINASPLFTALLPRGLLRAFGETDPVATQTVLEQLEDASQRIARSRPAAPDAEATQRELLQAIRLARHGAWRLLRAAGAAAPDEAALRRDLSEAIEEQHACWLARARPGGLQDSLGRLEATLGSYAS